MRNIYLILISTLTALILSACGGGGSDASFSEAQTKDYIVDCNTTTPVYTQIDEGDTLVKEGSATVEIIHDSNNDKQVCTLSGIAYLIKG